MSRKKCHRPVVTPYTRKVCLFRYEQMNRGWRSREFRTISQREALRLVSAGDAEQVIRMVDEVLQVVGFQALKPIRAERPSPTTLTLATMQAVVGLRSGYSADREVDKFVLWPFIGDDRAVAVRPRVSTTDRKRAQGLWGPVQRAA